MKCPIDGADLVLADRAGVEIDYCPQCRGVWLDRGELDKIIERSAEYAGPGGGTGAYAPPPDPRGYDRGDHDGRRRDHDGRRGDDHDSRRGGRRRRGGFLGDLFDF